MALLEIKNLVKDYGDVEALKGINLSIEKGEVVVILGPSGCGKSTFLRCLNGLEEIKSGQILLQNVWGSDNICIKEKKKFGGKNLAYGLCGAGLGDFVVKFMQKMKMVRKAVKWSKIGFYFA